MTFTRDILRIDGARTVASLRESIKRQVHHILRKRGAVVAVSGGIDSSVCAALASSALGKEHTLALFMPERETSSDSVRFVKMLAAELGIQLLLIDITDTLEAAGCYNQQEQALRKIVPDYADGWKHKITLPPLLSSDRLNLPRLVVQPPSGRQTTHRMTAQSYLQLIAATNYKQRVRKMTEYFHADRLNYAVCGTSNRLEHDQGFFVKLGDGSGDFKPIAHLYKTQVYQLAEELGIPEEIRKRPPTPETAGLSQTSEDFFFSVPYEVLDLCLFAHDHAVPPEEAAPVIGLSAAQVRRVYNDIKSKRRATLPLHLPPLYSEEVPSISQAIQGAVSKGFQE